jgi:hypothetical protein
MLIGDPKKMRTTKMQEGVTWRKMVCPSLKFVFLILIAFYPALDPQNRQEAP